MPYKEQNALDRFFSKAYGLLVRSGLGLPSNYLLEVKGRKSGRSYSTPVNLLTYKSARYLVAPRGFTQWVRNVEASQEAILMKGTNRERVRLSKLEGNLKPEILKEYLDKYKMTVQRFFPVRAGSPVEAFQPLAAEYPVFEVHALSRS